MVVAVVVVESNCMAHAQDSSGILKSLVSKGANKAPEFTSGAAVCSAAYSCWENGVLSCACVTQAGAAAVANSVPFPASLGVASGATLYAPELENMCSETAHRLKLPAAAVALTSMWSRFKNAVFPKHDKKSSDGNGDGNDSESSSSFAMRKLRECEERNDELKNEMKDIKHQLKELTNVINEFVAGKGDKHTESSGHNVINLMRSFGSHHRPSRVF